VNNFDGTWIDNGFISDGDVLGRARRISPQASNLVLGMSSREGIVPGGWEERHQ
jgi:hypothetical protein